MRLFTSLLMVFSLLLSASPVAAGDGCLGDPGYVLTVQPTAEIGGGLEFCLEAPESALAYFLVSLDTGPLPTPYGDLCVGPTLSGVFAIPLVGGQPLCSLHHVECDPNLIGVTVHGQFVAFGNGGVGVSNVDSVMLTDGPCNMPDCGECEGKVTELTLLYSGPSGFIEVEQKNDGDIVFADDVMNGETFSFSGTWVQGTLSTEISIYVDGQLDQKIHTSCSQEIGIGSVFGNYTVVAGASKVGGPLCPIDDR